LFCPSCGAKNDRGEAKCFVCDKTLPAMNGGGGDATPSRRGGAPRLAAAAGGGPVMARLGDRLIAVALDTMFLAAILLVTAAAILWKWPKAAEGFSRLTVLAMATGAAVLLLFLYHWLLEGAFGATMGKAIIGVRVTRHEDGHVPGFGLSAIRNALRVVDALPFYLLGFFVAVFSRARKRIGDYAARTVVLEHPVSLGERITVVVLWLIGIGAALWGAWMLAPGWFHLPLK